ncbi:MAG: sugar phosphate isomerase/epimerase family protein, partial [Gemmatimonadaceae bacterium]
DDYDDYTGQRPDVNLLDTSIGRMQFPPMRPSQSRRDFLKSAAALAPLVALPRAGLPASPKIGYAAITWNEHDLEAIDDIASLGFRGIQLRSNILSSFGNRPEALSDLLRSRGLAFVALSSGSVGIDAPKLTAALEMHVSNARFLRAAGGLYLQLTDDRPRGRTVTPDDCQRLGTVLTEIGRRTAELGIPVGYHPHMGTIGERPEDSDRVMAAADPRYVKLLLDVAHYQQGGGDPVAAIRRYRDRLLLLHIKDVESPVPANAKESYRFVELGRGRVNIRAVFAALAEVGFNGWAVIELDSVTDPTRTPKESAAISKQYLSTIGVSLN